MENKINVAELLKECPKGMELDCTLFDDVVFERVDSEFPTGPIILKRLKSNTTFHTNKYGHYYSYEDSKCIIFPKGKTSWEGFIPPCKFKDGDIIYTLVKSNFEFISIFKKASKTRIYSYVDLGSQFYLESLNGLCTIDNIISQRLATEEEKKKLFDAIKENGYKWNEETKTLEKLIEPKFKIGDRIKNKDNDHSSLVVEIRDDCFIIKTLDGFHHSYLTDKLPFSKQAEYELVTDKFNINTLKPFDKVLVRSDIGQKWTPDFFGFMDNDKGFPFVCVRYYVIQCIPFTGNEHLIGTTADCEEYYKTWE